MSQRTATIGLKKPEGTDPFLTQDFAENYDRIDAAFAARPIGGAGHEHAEYLTEAEANTLYVRLSHLDGHATGSGGTTGALTIEQGDARYAFAEHGTHGGGSGDATAVKAPGRTNPRIVYGVTGFSLNNVNGMTVLFNYSEGAFSTTPVVLATVQVGSNYDLLPNVQGRTAIDASVRVSQIKGLSITTTGQLQWMAVGV